MCQQCGYESAKWLGKCPSCNNWNSFVEEIKITGVQNSRESRQPGKRSSKEQAASRKPMFPSRPLQSTSASDAVKTTISAGQKNRLARAERRASIKITDRPTPWETARSHEPSSCKSRGACSAYPSSFSSCGDTRPGRRPS